MRHYTIATAGHVDHGKSTLVKALTGINPDRLIEEQKREMTIDLGFAYLTLPTQAKDVVGIIDVPGHIDFIENMLAGVGGIDAALLIIAADEGPMPQTREHLAILDLLKVKRGIVALTKTDLVPDPEWLPLVIDDIRALLAPTPLANAPIMPVSARQGKGLKELLVELNKLLRDLPLPTDLGKPRLPIDRVFTIAGFGTVVTGTLVEGGLAIGDEVAIMPKGTLARVRGLQTHGKKMEQAQPGSRVAVNLTGISLDDVKRGDTLIKPGTLSASTRIDVQIELAHLHPSAFIPHPASFVLRHNTEVKFFCGAAETLATVKVLEGSEITADKQQENFAQLELAEPVAVGRGDRFILRLPSPSITIGGGTVIDPSPTLRYRRRAGRVGDEVLTRLDATLKGTPAERIEATLRGKGLCAEADLAAAAQMSGDEVAIGLAELTQNGKVLLCEGVVGLTEAWQISYTQAATILGSFHKANLLAEGMPRDTLRSRLGLSPKVFGALLRVERIKLSVQSLQDPQPATLYAQLVDGGETVHLAAHVVQFNGVQQKAVDALMRQIRAQPWNTPLIKDCRAMLGDDVFEVLLRQQKLIAVGPDVVFLPETYQAAAARVREVIQRDGQITAAQVRDMFNTSRKYALALLEHLDEIGVTKRVGDARILRN